MSLSAREAKASANAYHESLVKAHAKEYEERKAEERRKIVALRNSGRYMELIENIEGHVRCISAKGGRTFCELKYGAFYLKGNDTLLYDDLTGYFRDQGYKVVEYAYHGLQLQW